MYDDKRLPDLNDLKEIAWQLRTKSAGSKAGFVVFSAPSKRQDDNDEDID